MFTSALFRFNVGVRSRLGVTTPASRWLREAVVGAALFAGIAIAPALAVEREVVISGPSSISAGATLSVSIAAHTWVKGEGLGFLHAQYSIDGGAHWVDFCFEKNVGSSVSRRVTLTAGAAGTEIRVRSRVAFRGGAAGDVDFKGQPIDWDGTWEKWRGPPAKYLVIPVAG